MAFFAAVATSTKARAEARREWNGERTGRRLGRSSKQPRRGGDGERGSGGSTGDSAVSKESGRVRLERWGMELTDGPHLSVRERGRER